MSCSNCSGNIPRGTLFFLFVINGNNLPQSAVSRKCGVTRYFRVSLTQYTVTCEPPSRCEYSSPWKHAWRSLWPVPPRIRSRSANYPRASFRRVLLKRDLLQRQHTQWTRINYKIVSVTNLNKYLHYGTSRTELYVYKYRCK